jgi:hypothetical protein
MATELGRCPWCRTNVEWARGDRSAVCAVCGARYATAQALAIAVEPAAASPRKSRFWVVAWYGAVTAVYAGLVVVEMLHSHASAAVLAAATVIAVLVYLLRRT